MSLLALAALAAVVVALVLVCSGGAAVVADVDPGGVRALALGGQDDGQKDNGAIDDPEKEGWEDRLDRREQRRTIVVGIFLGIVLLILVLWWGWGKVYHRPRKL